ncbi:acetyl-CoA carboxylase carboxyltransferase subunit beta [Peptoniphilus mikwangii]|uniref:acetyl-CoA carboxylase carboxyltransferase subunit beta n=1 Tax=Peptoniphilus mikwangii TaxID=1354300 RepID=UPI0004015E88|nr:acetyl-CoA carboxylase carboxyltransferase subunit beta [Peptoniphilus mikwangii]
MDYFKRKKDIFKKIKEIRDKRQNSEKKILEKSIVFSQCKNCESMIFEDELTKNMRVCPNCGYHLKISSKDRLKYLMDNYAFIEFKKYESDPLEFEGYEEKKKIMRDKTSLSEAVIVVKGAISGNKCYVFLMDSDFFMGSMGVEVGERIAYCFELAAREQLPVVGFCASGGARMQEGIFSLMQMANTTFALRKHSEMGNLYISVLTDPTTGGVSASFASLADIIIAEPGARICFTGRRVIEETIKQELPKDFQSAEFLIEHGFLDEIVDRREQKNYIGKILSYHRRKDEDRRDF